MVWLNREPTLSLDLQVQPVQALPVPLDGEIRDRLGDRPQHIHHRPDIPIRRLGEHVELLAGFKAHLIERRINIPPLPHFRPLRDWSLQDIG